MTFYDDAHDLRLCHKMYLRIIAAVGDNNMQGVIWVADLKVHSKLIYILKWYTLIPPLPGKLIQSDTNKDYGDNDPNTESIDNWRWDVKVEDTRFLLLSIWISTETLHRVEITPIIVWIDPIGNKIPNH